jgi:hypothetical protein
LASTLAKFNEEFERVPMSKTILFDAVCFYVANQEIAKRKAAEATARKTTKSAALSTKSERN